MAEFIFLYKISLRFVKAIVKKTLSDFYAVKHESEHKSFWKKMEGRGEEEKNLFAKRFFLPPRNHLQLIFKYSNRYGFCPFFR